MATLVLTTKISQDSNRELNQKVIVANYGDGFQQRAALGLKSRYDVWNLKWNNLNLTDRNTWMTFFETHGLVNSFDWTPPNGTAGKWVFTSAPQESSTGFTYSISVQVTQVFE